MTAIANKIIQLAKAYPGSTRQLALAAHVNYPQLTRVLNGTRPPSLLMCEQLADFLGYELRLAACSDGEPCEHLKELQALKLTQRKALGEFVKTINKKGQS